MAWYYVKDDGTAESGTATGDGGRYTSQKTGDWSTAFSATTEYYASIDAAVGATTTPTDGDYILVSDLHNKTYDPPANVAISGAAHSGAGLYLISVDDTACDAYKPGAYESITGGDDYVPDYNVGIFGVHLETTDNTVIINQANSTVTICDATLTSDANTDLCIYSLLDGVSIKLVNVILDGNTNSEGIYFSGGGLITWDGGSVTGSIDELFFTGSFNSEGGSAYLNGVDLTAYSGKIIQNLTEGTTDRVHIRLTNCKLSSGTSATPVGTLPSVAHRFEMFNCDVAAGGQNRFHIETGSGKVVNNDSTYVTADEAWGYDGTTKSSMEVTTTSSCSHIRPFTFELPAQWVDFSAGASDVITVELITTHATSAITLTDTEIAAFLVYPDGTTEEQPNWVTSGKTVGTGNYGIDPLAAGTTLTLSSLGVGDWIGELSSTNFYKMTLDTTGDAGAKGVASIRIEVYKPSITAGQLFISPQISLS